MARTPRTRGGSRSEPTAAETPSEDSPPTGEAGAPAEFAASESLAPPDDTGSDNAGSDNIGPDNTGPDITGNELSSAGTVPAEAAPALPETVATPSETGEVPDDPPPPATVSLESPASAPAEFAASESLAPTDDAASEPLAPPSGVTDPKLSPSEPAELSSEAEKALAEPPAAPGETGPDVPRGPDAFSAPDALTPGENAALAEPPSDAGSTVLPAEDGMAAGPGEAKPEDAAPETSEADSFRFADELAPAAEDAPRAEEEKTPEAAAPSSHASATEMEGPGIAATPIPLAVPEERSSSAEDRDSPPAPAPFTPQPAKRGGGLFAAGLLGGIAALLLAGLLQYFGFLPSLGASGQAGGGGNTQALQSEIDALKTQLSSLSSQTGNGSAAADPALVGAVDALKTEVAQLKSAGGGTAAVPPELEARVAAAEQKLAGMGGGASADELAALSGKVLAAETLAQTNEGAVKDAAARIGTLEQNFSGVQGTVSGLQTSLGTLQKQVDTLGAQPRVALALAASALKATAERGAPFTAELATLGTLAPDAPEIAQLQPYATSGVPTREALLADWNGSVDAVLASAKPADADQGIMGRLMSGAGSLVSVRPIGAVEGTDAQAVVGRIQAAMDAGDLGKALAEYDTLPDAAKQAAAGFAEKARARLAVESLVNQAITSASKAA